MGEIFDSHAHYDDKAFCDDFSVILEKVRGEVCGIINVGTDMKSSEKSVKLSEEYDFIWAAVGIHPHSVKEVDTGDMAKFFEMAQEKRVVAVGEIGLDYHYDFSPREAQIAVFEEQLKLASECDLPVIIHDREAHEATIRLLKKYRPRGVVHCFSGGVEMAREIVGLGMYIGLGGAVTFKNAKTPVQVAAEVPIDRLLLETDAPYMAPVPFRGGRCDSTMIKYIAQKISELRDMDPSELLKATAMNARVLFNI